MRYKEDILRKIETAQFKSKILNKMIIGQIPIVEGSPKKTVDELTQILEEVARLVELEK